MKHFIFLSIIQCLNSSLHPVHHSVYLFHLPDLQTLLSVSQRSWWGRAFLLQVVHRRPPVLSLWPCHLSPGRLCGVASVRTGLVSTDDGDSPSLRLLLSDSHRTSVLAGHKEQCLISRASPIQEKSWKAVTLVFIFLQFLVLICEIKEGSVVKCTH